MELDARMEFIVGDLTTLEVDAIVNAANTSLLGGGGVDGAIHEQAGPELLEECRTLNGCNTGEAKFTQGYELPARYVIHTVGPVWDGGNCEEDRLLAECYRNSLEVAANIGIQTVAFPSISTGVFGFPIDRAASIALTTVNDFLKTNDSLEQVTFCCFSQADLDKYLEAQGRLSLA
jgi:O-acetyl-ADP-ribose deacetylase (regulator of RNase III)